MQCTLLSPLIEVDKSGGRAVSQRHAFAFMAQLDHQLGRLDFDMSTQVRQEAADAEALVCVEPSSWSGERGVLRAHAAHRAPLVSTAGNSTRPWAAS